MAMRGSSRSSIGNWAIQTSSRSLFVGSTLHCFDRAAHLAGNRNRLVGRIVVDDGRRCSFGDQGTLSLTHDGMLKADAGAAASRAANSDLDDVGESDLPAIVARRRRQDRAYPLLFPHVEQANPAEKLDPRRFEPTVRNDVVNMAVRVLIAPLDWKSDDN